MLVPFTAVWKRGRYLATCIVRHPMYRVTEWNSVSVDQWVPAGIPYTTAPLSPSRRAAAAHAQLRGRRHAARSEAFISRRHAREGVRDEARDPR